MQFKTVINILKVQHEEVLATVVQIKELLNSSISADDARVIQKLLHRLSSQLTAHIVQEDILLYPKLKNNEDPEVRKVADDYIDEMIEIGDYIEKYMGEWNFLHVISSKPEQFSDATNEMFVGLAKRVDVEEAHLFPLFSSLSPS